MGLTLNEYKEKARGQRKVGGLIKQDKADLVITGGEDTERAKENLKRIMMNIQKPIMDISSPLTQMFRDTQRIMDQLAGPINQMYINTQRITNQLVSPMIQLSKLDLISQINRLLIPSLAIIESPIYVYVKSTNQKRAYFLALREDDKILDVWLSEHNTDYPYALEEGKLYRYGARKGAMLCEAMAVIPGISIEGLENWLARAVERECGEKSIISLLLKDYWKSRRGREERYVLVDGRYIEDTSDIEDIADLKNEVEYIVLNYLAGLNPYQEENKELLFYATSSLTKQAITGSENRADTITRSVRRNLGVEYPRVKEGIKLLHNLCKDKSFEMQAFIRNYASFLLCRIFNG